ncbi:MAG TPA: hypothetical protein VH518_16145 [Tepidisphaeraceae bacterium]|jgi:hypothetical protein
MVAPLFFRSAAITLGQSFHSDHEIDGDPETSFAMVDVIISDRNEVPHFVGVMVLRVILHCSAPIGAYNCALGSSGAIDSMDS